LYLANILQHNKYYHCSHVAMQNIDCWLGRTVLKSGSW